MSQTPENLKYAKTHEWARLEDDGTITVGISDHAQELLGDLVFMELPEVGEVFLDRILGFLGREFVFFGGGEICVRCQVDMRGKMATARIVKLPFVRHGKSCVT